MPNPEAVMPSAETLAYLAGLAVAVVLVCGLGLLAARVCRGGSAPLRHGVLAWTLALVLLSPVAAWLAQRSGLALVRVTVTGQSSPHATATADRSAIADEPSHATASADAGLPAWPPFPLGTETGGEDMAGLDEKPRESIAESPPSSHIPAAAEANAPVSPGGSSFAVGEPSPVGRQGTPPAWWQVGGSLAAWLWAVGAALALIRLGRGYVALARFCRRLVPLEDPRQKLLVHEAADALGLRRLPKVYVSRLAGVPMSIGLFRPAIVLPASMPREHDRRQQQAVLLHEVAHIARRDHWVGVGQRIAGALFWWNPLVHRVCDGVSELREEICDNHVIRIQGEGQRLARVLVDLAGQVAAVPLLPSAVAVLEPRPAGLTGRVTRLLNKERNMDTRMNLRSRLFLLTCAVVALIGMAMVGGLRLADAQSVVKTNDVAAEEQSLSTDTVARGGHFDFQGQVLDPDGEPLAGANVYLVFYTNFTHAKLPPPEVRATTGTDGTFHFTMEQSEFDAWRADHRWGILDDVSFRNDSRIVVQAAGYGPVWRPAFVFDQNGEFRGRMLETYPEDAADIGEKQYPVVRLVKDDVPLVGRVVDPNGQAISGVKISVGGIEPVKNEDLTDWLSTAEGKDASVVKLMKHVSVKRVANGSFTDGAMSADVLPQIMPAAATDADGRVCLRGVGRERLAMLRIEGPGIESACMVGARTRPGPTLEIPYQMPWNPATFTYYGATFEHVARPSVPIVGTVRDEESGKPLPGVTIQAHKLADDPARSFVVAYYVRTTSDDEGRYRLTGMPIGKGNELLAVPPQGQPYLMSKKTVDVTIESDSVQADFELKRGVLIRGRVTDAKTGAAVRDCTVDYYAFHDNPHSEEAPGFDGASQGVGPYMTDREGRYAVPGLPGRGIVAVQVYSKGPTRYPLRAGVEKIPELSRAGGRYDKVAPAPLYVQSKNALAEVDPAEGVESIELDFQLDPGQEKDLDDIKIAPSVSAAVPASTWRMRLELDTPDLEPPVVQYAIFDKDPVPGFKARVARQRAFQQRQLELHAGDPQRMQAIRTAGRTVSWDLGFRDVTGADLHLLVSSPFRTASMMSNAPDGKKWVVTKTVQMGGDPTCWCLPVEVKKGKEVAVTLSESNTFDLEGAFQSAMKEDAE